jgi:hypothetical protein
MMRGNAAADAVPTCTVSVLFEIPEESHTEWAAKVVQRCWMTCRERMGFLLHQAAGRPPEEVCPVDASSA